MHKITNCLSNDDLHRLRKYAEKAFGLKCYRDLMDFFPNVKEITESMGCFEAADKYIDIKLNDPNTIMISVGDGSTPRTAAMFALRSAWNCYSVDPALINNLSYYPKWSMIKRLNVKEVKIENFSIQSDYPVVVVFCHSHVGIEKSLLSIKAPEYNIVAMQCCINMSLYDIKPNFKYDDFSVWSPCNNVKVWKGIPLSIIESLNK